MDEEMNGEQSDKQPAIPRTDQEKDKMTNRLKRIEGQVRGLQKMIEEDRYCIDILVQMSAVQSALNKVGYTVMERHAKTCVTGAIKTGNGDESIDELMKVIKQFAK